MEEPRYYFFAPLDSGIGGPIALGSIIEQPKFADLPLNESPVAIKDEEILKPAGRKDYYLNTSKTVGGSVGLFADFLGPILGVSGNASIDYKITRGQDVSCDLLETRWFRPKPQYIKESIDDPNVKNYVIQNRSWMRGQSKLFMITGIKIAHNATFAYKTIKERGVKFHFGLDGTNSGVPLKMGPDVDLRNDPTREEGFTIVEPFVLAYRINEIIIEAKSGNTVSNRPHTDGAALGTIPLPNNEEIELFASIEERDASAVDAGLDETAQDLEAEDGKFSKFARVPA